MCFLVSCGSTDKTRWMESLATPESQREDEKIYQTWGQFPTTLCNMLYSLTYVISDFQRIIVMAIFSQLKCNLCINVCLHSHNN